MKIEIFDESKSAHLDSKNPLMNNCSQDLVVLEAEVGAQAVCPITGREMTLRKGNVCDQNDCRNRDRN
jgi:hypothetical protein